MGDTCSSSVRRPRPDLRLLVAARRAVLATIRSDGRPRLVPIAFATEVAEPLVLYSALDEKPKAVADSHELARVHDILRRPAVTVLVDRWSEDWSELAWLRLDGTARILEPSAAEDRAEHAHALTLLRARYAQYAGQQLETRPVIRIEVASTTGWRAAR